MKRDQRIYLGPRLHQFGIGYGTVFYNGVHPRFKEVAELCPAIDALLVPISNAAAVRRELAFDYAHNMRGRSGKFVTFYREVERWLASASQRKQEKTTSTINIKTHA